MTAYRPPLVGNLHCDYHFEVARLREEHNEHAVLERIHLPKLEAGGVDFEFHTVGGDHRQFTRDDDLTLGTLRMIEHAWRETEESKHFVIATSAQAIRHAQMSGRKALVLTLEGAAPVREDLSLLHVFYRLGLRSICLTWFKANPTADGVNERRGGGLTNFGRALVQEMNRLGMLVDLSQSTDATVDDVLEISTRPVVASHSASRAVHPHPRNLSDDQLRALRANGGLLGLTAFPAHLGKDRPTLETFLDHVDHVVNVAGADHVCLGLNIIVHESELAKRFFSRSNIDYTNLWLPGLEDLDKVPAVVEGLLKRGHKEAEIDTIMGGNLLRIVEQVIG
jgi:membrane dipeptidase